MLTLQKITSKYNQIIALTDLLYKIARIMGNNTNKQQRVIPETGYRVIAIHKKHILAQLNLLTDYIISPDPKLIDLRRDSIRFQVYSILSQDTRSIQLPISNRQLGIQVRLDQINTCILRITKIFPGSPLQKYNIHPGQFIVGILEGNFNCIKSFAQFVSNITIVAPKSNLSLGICGQDGKTRIVAIPVMELKAWQMKRKGLLGCELAEGWMHKWKPSKQKKQKIQEMETKTQQTIPNPQIQIPRVRSFQSAEQKHSDSSQQIDKKCDTLDPNFNTEGVMEIKYKGILKNEEIADASTICKCRPINKACQRCFIQKDQNFYFFNIKTSQIIALPTKMMLPIEQ